MTVETRKFVSPIDISAVEFECKKCESKLLLNLGTLERFPTVCTSCGEQWIIHNSDAHGRLHRFLQSLKEYAQANGEPYRLRFQVAEEQPPK